MSEVYFNKYKPVFENYKILKNSKKNKGKKKSYIDFFTYNKDHIYIKSIPKYISNTSSIPLGSNNLFKVFLKSINKNYLIPAELKDSFPQTFKLINDLEFLNYKIDYYQPIYSILSNRLVQNFDYLFKAGIIFFLLANSKSDQKQIDELRNLMKINKDPLLDELNFFLDNQTYLNKKVFEFLSNLFLSNSVFYSSNIPQNSFELFVDSKRILYALNNKSFIDSNLLSEINNFLNSFSSSIGINLNTYLKNVNYSDIEIWRKFFSYFSSILNVFNNIKSYPIQNKQDLEKFLELMYLLNLSVKDSSNAFYVQNKLPKEHKDIFSKSIDNYQSSSFSYDIAVKNTSSDFLSSYNLYVNSFIKKTLKNKDFSYGDSYHFLRIYLYSSYLLELLKNSMDNTNEFKQYKQFLASTLLNKGFANNFYQILNLPDKQKILSALEILRTVSLRATFFAFPNDQNLPKDRTLYLRLNFWIKVFKNIPKDDNYQKNVNYMLSYLRKILSDYPNTNQLISVFSFLDSKNINYLITYLDSIFSLLSSSNISKKYENLDYLFSQSVIYTYFQNEPNFSKSMVDNFISNIYQNDRELLPITDDYNYYSSLDSKSSTNALLNVLGSYYNNCLALV